MNIVDIGYTDGLTVTPSDAADLVHPIFASSKAFIVTAAGTIKLTLASGSVLTFTVNAGVIYNIAAKRFWATGTTATGIVALY